MTFAEQVDQIMQDLQSRLMEWDPAGETWGEHVESAMNEAWDRLRDVSPQG